MEDETIKEIYRKLMQLEQHIINLIIPIQNIAECLKSQADLKYLMETLRNPPSIPIDSRNLNTLLASFSREMKDFDKKIDSLEKMNNESNAPELKFIGNRVNEIEKLIKKIQGEGIKKNIELDFRCDGYEMVKKPIGYDKDDPIEDAENNLRRLLDELTKREAQVLIHRLGLLGEKRKTLEAIGKIIEISRERVRMIEAKALRKLRHPSRKEMLSKITHKELLKLTIGEDYCNNKD